MQNQSEDIDTLKNNILYGGFWRRFAAALVDSVIVTVISFPFIFLMITSPQQYDLWSIFVLCIDWLYSSLMTSSSHQATVGKMLLKMAVVNEEHERLTWAEATLRYMCFLSVLSLFIGFLMVAFHPRKRGLHDILAKTYVIRVKISI